MSKQVGKHPVELTGEVRAVTLHDDGGGTFQLRLESGADIAADFTVEHEAGIINALLRHRFQHLTVSGPGDFGKDGQLKRLLRVDRHALGWIPSPALPFDTTGMDISEIFIAGGKLIPEEEWAKFPPDFAENMDHYMYGLPKRGEE